MRTRHLLALLAGVGAFVLLAGCVEDEESPRIEREFTMTASQFRYDPPALEVPEGARVTIRITSADVAHGIVIPEFGVNEKIAPGETTTVTFVASRSGAFDYYCNVFCGTGHPQHRGKLTVVA